MNEQEATFRKNRLMTWWAGEGYQAYVDHKTCPLCRGFLQWEGFTCPCEEKLPKLDDNFNICQQKRQKAIKKSKAPAAQTSSQRVIRKPSQYNNFAQAEAERHALELAKFKKKYSSFIPTTKLFCTAYMSRDNPTEMQCVREMVAKYISRYEADPEWESFHKPEFIDRKWIEYDG